MSGKALAARGFEPPWGKRKVPAFASKAGTSYGGELGIRTLGGFTLTAFRVLFALGTFVSAVVGGGSFGNGENPCAATDFGRAGRY